MDEKIQLEFENRIGQLESLQSQTLRIVQKIERRLIGDIEDDKPGLVDDFRAVRKIVETFDGKMIRLEQLNLEERIISVESSVTDLTRAFQDVNKWKWAIWGGIIVFVFFVDKIWEIVKEWFKTP